MATQFTLDQQVFNDLLTEARCQVRRLGPTANYTERTMAVSSVLKRHALGVLEHARYSRAVFAAIVRPSRR
ncbi:MAG: hypothetical protein WDZ93_00330 [Candidatus Paceibacterota bacterium]